MASKVRLGEELPAGQYRLLVPVPEETATADAERVIETAAMLARERDGGLLVVSLTTLARQTPLDAVSSDTERETRETAAELTERAADVSVAGFVRMTHEEMPSILDTIAEHDCDGVILTVEAEHSQRRRLLAGSTVEKIVGRAECDVFVEKLRSDESPIRRILLAVSGGPHSGLAAETAGAVARVSDASVNVVHFLGSDPSDDERDEANTVVRRAERALSGVEGVETDIESVEDIAEAIITRSNEYDVTVLGAPTSGLLRQFVFGTVPDSVNQRAENGVLMVQRNTDSTSVYDRWVGGDPTE